IASHHVRALIPSERLTLSPTASKACQDADALIVMTEWHEFESPDFSALSHRLKGKAVFDGRRLYDAGELRARGLWHYVPGQRLPPSDASNVHHAVGTPIAQRAIRQDAGPAPLDLNVSIISQRSRP